MVGIIVSWLLLKVQLDESLTLKKAIDAARQSEAAKREQAVLRNFLPNTFNCRFCQGKKAAEAPSNGLKDGGETSMDQPKMQLLRKVTGA